MTFKGSDYDPALDEDRLLKQIGRIYSVMIDGEWRTLSEIAFTVKAPEASISAQLRNLRKEGYGHYLVNKHRRGEPHEGLFEYQLLKREVKEKQFEMGLI